MRRTEIKPGEQGFAHRVELYQDDKLVEILETDDQAEALAFANLHFQFQKDVQ